MDYQAVLREAGMMEQVLPDGERRAWQEFSDRSPSAAEVLAWANDRLRQEAGHLWPVEMPAAVPPTTDIPAWLPPAERLTLARQAAPVPEKHRPRAPELTEQQVAELATLSPVARLARYREMAAQA